MSVTNFHIDIDRLPDEVLSYTDQIFYDFVESFIGKLHAQLLSYLHISSVPCFLLTENPCAILTMEIEDEVLEKLNQEICVKLKNNQFIVKPGVENNFKRLKLLLTKKNEEQTKKAKQKNKQHRITDVNNTSTQQSISSSNTISQSLSLTSSFSSLTINDHRQYLVDLIHHWCIDNKTSLELNELDLKEDTDFTLFFSNINNILESNIQCKCGSKLNLGKNAEKFQLSNYYKHLKDTNCSHIRALKRREQQQIQIEQEATPNSVTTHSDIQDVVMKPTSHSMNSSSSRIDNKKRRNNSESSQTIAKKKK